MKKFRIGLLLLIICIPKYFYGQEKQNVLFIAIDDLNNYVTLLENYPGIKTPNLDKFAKTSLTFEKAYCPAPVCNPSRIAVLTGKSPVNTGLYELTDEFQNSKVAMNATLLPELFKENGYTTMWSGKLFHTGGNPSQTRPGKERMKAMWDDKRGQDGGYGPMATVNNVTDTITRPMWFNYQKWEGPERDFPDVVNSDLTIERLRKNYDKPFFMALGFYRPHDPWTAPKRFFDMYPLEEVQLPEVLEDDLEDLPDIAKEWAHSPLRLEDLKKVGQWKPSVRAYLAAISFMDYNLGRVLDALDKSPYRDNTIVVLWADNGFHMGEKHHFAKQALWEQTTHVLSMIRAPGITEDGATRKQPVNLLDIYPTLVELCDLPQPKQTLDGVSLVPVIRDENYERKQPAITYYKYGSASIRTMDWRYIRYYDGTEELYNESEDPSELTNLADDPDHQQVINELAQWLPEKITPKVRNTTRRKSTVINKNKNRKENP
jgi:arylsulfatase A-like enzyme